MWQISVTVQKTGNKFQSSQKSCRGICVKSWIDLQCDWQVSETSVLEERNFWGSRIWAPAWIECTSPVLKQSSFGCAVLLLCKFLCFTLVWANSSKMVIGLVLILLCCLLLFLYCVGKTYFKQTLYMYGNWVFWETWKLLGFFSCGFTFTFLHTMFLSGKSFAQIVTLEKTTAKSKKKKMRSEKETWPVTSEHLTWGGRVCWRCWGTRPPAPAASSASSRATWATCGIVRVSPHASHLPVVADLTNPKCSE